MAVIQYPHTVELKYKDLILYYRGRIEFSTQSRVMEFNGREVLVKAIFYMPLPVADIDVNWSAKVYNAIYTGGQTAGILASVFSFHSSVQVQTDVTVLPGGVQFINGTTEVVVPDWIGWKIKIERIGQGTMKEGVDYTWNYLTGTLNLLALGDIFQPLEWFDVTFEPKINNGIISEQEVIDLGNTVLYNGTIKQFSRGQLNARIWI